MPYKKQTILVTGGCRSGKSRFALDIANRLGGRRLFLATCKALDNEMAERIQRHKLDRGPEWRTLEEPLLLPESVIREAESHDLILIDCITLWISNLLFEEMTQEEVIHAAGRLAAAMPTASCSLILVTNEVGAGIVPENRLARIFRDTAGYVNQKLAQSADAVYWTVAGIPVRIK